MSRVTYSSLVAMASRIDYALGLPEGTHQIAAQHEGKRLVRDGGSREISPRLSTGQLYDWLQAYDKGIWDGRRALVTEAGHVPGYDEYGWPIREDHEE